MKSILVYTDPLKRFITKEHEDLAKIQIDNSLALGWKPEDIILATNFNYEHNGVKSTLIDEYVTSDNNRSTKVPVMNQLFRDGVIGDDVYWFHDHDAFQLVPFEVKLDRAAGFTNHGYSTEWNAGSFFFKKDAKDIFLKIWESINSRNTNEQTALTYLWDNNIDGINDKYELMNQTYNIGIYHIDKLVEKAQKPIKVAHFHPHKRRHLDLFRSRNMLPERLLTIFSIYGIR